MKVSKFIESDSVYFGRITAPVSFLSYQKLKRLNKMRSVCLLFCLTIFLNVLQMAPLLAEGAGEKYLTSQDGDVPCVCQIDFDPNVDYFASTGKVSSRFSTGFEVSYHNFYKRISVNDGATVIYAYLCGTPRVCDADKLELYADDVNNPAVEILEITIPFKSVAVTSTTFLPYIEFINERRSVKRIQTSSEALSDCSRKRFEEGKVLAGYGSYDEETIEATYNISGSLDAIFADGSFSYSSASLHNNVAGFNAKWNENVAVIPLYETEEADALGVAEWVEYMSLFYNREIAANAVADNIDLRFNCTSNLVELYQNNTNSYKPKVSFFAFYSWSGYTGLNCPADDDWKCQMIERLGGEPVNFDSGNFNHTLFSEQVKDADVLIYMNNNFNVSTDFAAPFYRGEVFEALQKVRAVQNELVFDILGEHYPLWFEDRPAEPDVLLRDLVDAVYGENTIIAHNKSFIRNVFTEDPAPQFANSSNCPTNESQPLYTNWIEGGCAISIPGTVGGPGTPVTIPGIAIPPQSFGACINDNSGNDEIMDCETPTSSPTTSAPTTSPTTSSPTTSPTTSSPTTSPTLSPGNCFALAADNDCETEYTACVADADCKVLVDAVVESKSDEDLNALRADTLGEDVATCFSDECKDSLLGNSASRVSAMKLFALFALAIAVLF